MESKFMNTEKNKPNKSVLNLSQRQYLRSLDKHVTLQNVSIYYVWKNIRKQYKKYELKIIAAKWNADYQMVLILFRYSRLY